MNLLTVISYMVLFLFISPIIIGTYFLFKLFKTYFLFKKLFKEEKEIEQFYKTPEDIKKLKKEVREILENMSTNTNESIVIIKLGSKSRSHKFVLMKDEEKRKYLVALPIEQFPLHKDIVSFVRMISRKSLYVLGGGYIKTEGHKLVIYGRSLDYGEANKHLVKKILQNAFPDINVEVVH